MSKSIAVERNLTPVAQYLSEKGYKVEEVDFGSEYNRSIDKYDALVVTGMTKDFLGIEDIVSKKPVIDAKGLSAEEVYDEISTMLKG